MFYEILLGWKAFRMEFELVLKQGSELAWLEWHADLETTARPVNEVIPAFPPDVSEVIAMMMAKRAHQRFQTYSAVLTALSRTTEPAQQAEPKPETKSDDQRTAAQPVEKPKKQPKPAPTGERPPVPKVLLVGGVAAVLVVGLVSMFASKRTPAAKPGPAATTAAVPGTAARPAAPTPTQLRDLPKSIQTSTGTMMLVPDGEFLSGTQGKTVKLPSYYIDKTEVTNAAYRMFCDAAKRPYPKNPIWDRQYFDKADYPVLNVSWNDACEFAAWAGKRLPSEDEWEKAARGTEGRTYPWGNWSQSTAANLKGSEDGHLNAAPVGSFPYDESPFGVLDTEGNVEEWVAGDFGDGKRVVRGGGFTATVEQANLTSRRGESPNLVPAVFSNVGFRCAASPDSAMQTKK
jgi:formylglycine-generating enzyme required for sulfatase activity